MNEVGEPPQPERESVGTPPQEPNSHPGDPLFTSNGPETTLAVLTTPPLRERRDVPAVFGLVPRPAGLNARTAQPAKGGVSGPEPSARDCRPPPGFPKCDRRVGLPPRRTRLDNAALSECAFLRERFTTPQPPSRLPVRDRHTESISRGPTLTPGPTGAICTCTNRTERRTTSGLASRS